MSIGHNLDSIIAVGFHSNKKVKKGCGQFNVLNRKIRIYLNFVKI